MAPSIRPGFRFFSFLLLCAFGLAGVGCPSSDDDDDDDSGEGEGEGEGETCDPRICDGDGEMCCPVSEGEGCVNTNIMFNDCGGCGEACNDAVAGTCVDGECRCGTNPACAEGSELCCGRDKSCIDPTSNPEFCGSCNETCIGPTAEKTSDRCVDGGCVCGDTGAACTGRLNSTCCPAEGGGASCQDIQIDVQNCGGCSLADRADDDTHDRDDGILDAQFTCDPLMANLCRLASCVCGIPEDLGIDPAPCEGTRQSTCCAPPGGDATLAICANIDSDEAHCGECNNPCAQGDECIAGVCG